MFPYLEQAFRRATMQPEPVGLVAPNPEGWTVEHLDWADPATQATRRRLQPSDGWNFLQGRGTHAGHLLGGCLEVLEWLRGSPVWPTPEQWRGAILFLETSEEAPPPTALARALRAYAAEGVLAGLAASSSGAREATRRRRASRPTTRPCARSSRRRRGSPSSR